MQSLLQQFGALGGAPAAQPLVTFKAGKMEPQDKGNNKFLIVPDLRKGQVNLIKGDDQLIHFQWKDRKTQTMVDDLILFPDDAVFKKVKTGKEADRVYLLQYKGSNRRFFFWMQDANCEKDEEHCASINKFMSDPNAAPTTGSSGGEGAYMDLLRGLNNAAPSAAGAASNRNVQVSDLQQILQSLGLPAPSAASTAPAAPAGSGGDIQTPPAPISSSSAPGGALTTEALQAAMANVLAGAGQTQIAPLQAVLNADEIVETGILNEEDVQKQLMELLPEGQQTPEELYSLIHGPQFQQALGALSSALQNGNFQDVTASFGIDPAPGTAALAQGNGIEAFLQALAAQYGNPTPTADATDEGKETEEEKKSS